MSTVMKTQTKALAPIEQVRTDLQKMMPQFQMALPSSVSPDKFIRVTLTALQNSPDLLMCDRQSLFSSAMKCAADGLFPDGREAAFVKYGNKVQYLPMIGGIFKKLRNSSEITSITSQIIHEKDKFRYWVDSNGEHLEHEPLLFGGDRGPRVGVYAIAKLKDGGVEIEPMTEADVMAIKKVSKSATSGPWSGPFESEMWRKTAIRRLSKRLPMSTELAQVLERDDEIYDFKGHEASKSKAEELSDKLAFTDFNGGGDESSSDEPRSNDPHEFENFSSPSTIETTGKKVEDPRVVK